MDDERAQILRLVTRIQRDAAEVQSLIEGRDEGGDWHRIRALLSALGDRGGRLPLAEWRALATGVPFLYQPRGLGGFFRGGLVAMEGGDVMLTAAGWAAIQKSA